MTMKELAKMAGVSSAAVSRYLNGGSLSQEKRESIRAAMERTGYQPDAVAQMLRTRNTDHVGLIVPKLDSDAVVRFTSGAADTLARDGYLCLFADAGNDSNKELAYMTLFQKRSVAGIIMMATVMTPQMEEMLRSATVPVVVTGQRFRQIPCVYHDDFGAAFELTKLVLERGRRSLAFIGVTEQDVAVGVERRRGVQAAMKEFGLNPSVLPVEISSFDVSGGKDAMERLLQKKPELDGVICATDRIAFGAMETLRQAGRRVPEDVSIVGMDDTWACGHITPHLTTAHFYYKTSGQTAARLLIEMIRNKDLSGPVHQTMLGYKIQQRDSI